ncbi:MAG: ComEC/Rec2 family competence protein, partial [Melioribacteraceae bacterium]
MNDYPLIKFTLLFICGVILEYYLAINGVVLGVLLIVMLLVGTVCIYRYNKNVLLPTVLIFSSVIVFGSVWYSSSISNIKKYPFLDPKIKNVRVYGKVAKIDLIKEKRLTFNLSPDSILIGNKKYSYTTTFLCNLYDDDNLIRKVYDVIKIGNRVVYDCMISRPRNERNPFEFDYKKYLNDRGVTALATAYSIESLEVKNTDYSLVKNSVFEIRKYIDERITLVHNKTTQGMLRGLLLADRSGIDYQTNSDFMNAGVVHVLSVSGLHVGYIVIIFLFLFNRFNLYWRVSLTVVGLIVYTIITGSDAPVFRSTVMASVILVTPFFGRESNSYNTLSIAALIILLLDPKELFNPSFQLSFSAILSLIILYPVLSKFIKAQNFKSKVANYLMLFFGSTLIAQIGTLPFTLVYFGKISVTSLFANLFVIPISGVIVGLGIVSILFSTFSFWLAEVFAACNEFLTYLMLYLVQVFGNPSYSFINITQFSLYDSVIFYLTFGLIFSLWTRFKKFITKLLFVTLSFAVFIEAISFDNSELLPNNKLSVLAIDVGQGDSFLIKFPNGQIALVDAGEATKKFDNGKRVIIPLLDKLGIKKID